MKYLTSTWQPSFYYGWVIVTVVFLAEFIAAAGGSMTIPLFFEPMSHSLGWSLTILTGALFAQTLAYMFVSPFLGFFVDKYGARPVMTIGSLVAGIGLLLIMGVQEIWQFWMLYAVVGALGLHEMGQFTGPVVIAKWFIRKRGRAMAIGTFGTVMGGMVMAPVIGILINSFGWRQTWGIMGIMVLVVMVPICLFFMRREPEDMGLLPDGDSPTIATTEESKIVPQPRQAWDYDPEWTLREALRTPTLWILIVSLNLIGFLAGVITVHTVPYFTLVENMSAIGAGYVLTARLFSASISRILWGILVEKISVRWCLAMSFLGRSLGPISLVLIPYPYNIGALMLSSSVGGALGILQPMVFANYYGRRFTGTIQGTMRPLLTVSPLIGPLLVAMLYDSTGSFDLAFILATICGLLSTLVVLFAKPPRNPKVPGNGHLLSS